MADLGEIQQNPQTGEVRQLTLQGWVPISEEDAAEQLRDPAMRFFEGALGMDPVGEAGALGRIFGIGELLAPIGTAGSFGAKAGFKALRNRFGIGGGPQRVKGQIEEVGAAARQAPEDFVAGPQGISQAPGAQRSIGAAEAEQPAPAGFLQSIRDEFFQDRPLSADQEKLLASGRADELNFGLLPGQAQGRNLFVAGVKSDPVMAREFDPIIRANQDAGSRFARRALLLDESTPFGIDTLDEAATTIGGGLNQIGERVGRVSVGDDLFKRMNTIRKQEPFLEDVLEPEKIITGRQAMAWRSVLGSASRSAWRQGDETKARFIDETIRQIQNIIEKQLGPEDIARWKELKEAWRVFINFEKPGVVDFGTGDVKWGTLARNLRKTFKNEFGRKLLADPQSGLSPATRDLMDFTRLASAFRDQVGDSGTATRSALQNLSIEGGKNFLKRKAFVTMLRGMVEQQATTP